VAYALFPTAGIGSPLAQAPPFQGNLRARYESTFGAYGWHLQAGVVHTAHSYASTVTEGGFEPPNQNQNAYTTYDAAAGVVRDAWDVELYGENLTDVRAQLYVNGFDFVHTVTANRPRTLGINVTYSFSKPH
jgi:iron complex outermembrane recepter protein